MSADFFGIKLSWICEKGQLIYVDELIRSKKSSYVTYTNVHVVTTAKKDVDLRHAINSADLVSPDGMPLVRLGRLAGAHCLEKCSGPDMMLSIIENGLNKGYKHYFYGSTDTTLKELEVQLKVKYPDIQIVGLYSPPFRQLTQEEDQEIVDNINALEPDCIWVGLGAPKQELWMYQHRGRIHQGVMFGVGAAFDFHAGLLKRAPLWMQKHGLEWFYRLIQEPKRLFKRYFITNTLFIYYVLRHRIKVKNDHDCMVEDRMKVKECTYKNQDLKE